MKSCLSVSLVFCLCLETQPRASEPPTCNTDSKFALNLYQRAVAEAGDQNVFYSPFSIALTLAVLDLGARGETQKQLRKALDYNELHGTLSQHLEQCSELPILKRLSAILLSNQGSYQVSVANAMFSVPGLKLKANFQKSLKEYYNATVWSLSFSCPVLAAEKINSWVKKTTKGKIKTIVSSQDLVPETKLILANAVYFKGKWQKMFDPSETKYMKFQKADHSYREVLMMYREALFHQGDFLLDSSDPGSSYQVLELPYEDSSISMIIALPGNIDRMGTLQSMLNKDLISTWFQSIKAAKTKVFLPKFKLHETHDLKEVLRGLNITDIFKNTADFSGITDKKHIPVFRVFHEAFIEVNEEGTEAAAVSGASVETRSVRFLFEANRPFFFMVYNRITGSILFLGRLMDP
uniref:Serpin domain-containing protein n=2 Tax=Latimeria chalumnae TaxID=7897 RepID=M3XLM0_LATCH